MGSSLRSRFSSLRTRSKREGRKTYITDGPDLPKKEIGPAQDVLEEELLRLYWDGVRQDLLDIVSSLRHCLSVDTLEEEGQDVKVEDYETWVDITRSPVPEYDSPGASQLDTAFHRHAWDIYKTVKKARLHDDIRHKAQKRPSTDVAKRRARLLLQSAQWLDIDKLIEHREPPPQARLSPANLEQGVSKSSMPGFEHRKCHECQGVIRGSLYTKIKVEGEHRLAYPIICEGCYCDNHYGEEGFTKSYNTSPLPKALLSGPVSAMCKCHGKLGIRSDKKDSRPASIDTPLRHGNPECPVGYYSDILAESLFASSRLAFEKGKSLADYQEKHAQEDLKKATDAWRDQKRTTYRPTLRRRTDDEIIGELGLEGIQKASEPSQVPEYLRPMSPVNPWGMVHMALRVGPLVIENGVNNINGVLITTRNAPELQHNAKGLGQKDALIVEDAGVRTVYSQNRPSCLHRYKAIVKQVVGGTFCGFLDDPAEENLVENLLELARNSESTELQKSFSSGSAFHVFWSDLKAYLEPNAIFFIRSIAERLRGPMDIGWNQDHNNCQAFCNVLLGDPLLQRTFVRPPPKGAISANPEKPYLISFIINENSLQAVKPSNKEEVPNGFVEEFLLRIRNGRHDASDMFETLQEYWYNWGCLEQPMYQHQDIFPWDCTKAYKENLVKCGKCSLSKHVCTAPFDAWSLISLHLTRSRWLYPKHAFPITDAKREQARDRQREPSVPSDGKLAKSKEEEGCDSLYWEDGVMKSDEWNRNRLTVLLAQDALLKTATAMASIPAFRESMNNLSKNGSAYDRVKLGGLHRAQPYSHHFEKGAYRRFFIAPWANLGRQLRIDEYEQLRDERADMPDVGKEKQTSEQSSHPHRPTYNFPIRVPRERKLTAEALHGNYGQNWEKYVAPPPVYTRFNAGNGGPSGWGGVGGGSGPSGLTPHGSTWLYSPGNSTCTITSDRGADSRNDSKSDSGGGGTGGGGGGGCGSCGGCGG